MNKRRGICGLVLLIVASAVVVPLYIACVILTSESPMSHETFVRMSYARDRLFWVCLLLQVTAGWFLYSALPIQKALHTVLLRLIGLPVASIVCSFVFGASILDVADWYRLALRLFS